MQPVRDQQQDTAQRWVRLFLCVGLVAVAGSGVVGYRLITSESKSTVSLNASSVSEDATPSVTQTSLAPLTTLITDTTTDTTTDKTTDTTTDTTMSVTSEPTTIPEESTTELTTTELTTTSEYLGPAIETTTIPGDVIVPPVATISPGNAIENGQCLPVARPMPNPTRFQRMDATYKTNQAINDTVVLMRDNDLRAYEYTSDEHKQVSKWRVFEEPLRSYRIAISPRPTYVDPDNPPALPAWSSQQSDNRTSLPTDKYHFEDYALVGELTPYTTARAVCVYATSAVHPFGDVTSTENTISYVDSNGWMIEQVITITSTTNSFVHQHRLVFSEPASFIINEPAEGSTTLD